jgi:hypothetical protein
MVMAALPPTGGTHDPRPSEPPATDALALEEASRAYGVSVTTLRRLLRDERIAGAYKVPGPKGAEWRIPRGSLDALGYSPAQPAQDTTPQPAQPSADLAALVASIASLTDALDGQRRQLLAAEEDRGRAEREAVEARVTTARLEAQLDAERERSAELLTRLEAATARRGLFRRRKA